MGYQLWTLGFLACHHAHIINTGCMHNLAHAIAGLMLIPPTWPCPPQIILVCTGIKAMSIKTMPHAANARVFGKINSKPNNISNMPASIFSSTGNGK